MDPIRRLLTEAGNAKQTRAFWQAATGVLSDWAGGAHVQLDYQGLNESGTAQAGAPDASGEPFFIDYNDAEGRHVRAAFRGVPEGFPADVLRSALEIATHLAVMVARRAGLERERRLGTFLVELSRWLLAAPERELLLRYTLQSVMSLVEAQGAFVALRQREGDALRIAATVGQCAELQGLEVGLTTSTTGRVVRTGAPLLTDNILAEPDAQPALDPAGTARGAMIAPLKTSSGVAGAVGVVRYEQAGAETAAPPAFGLVDLQYLAAVAAYIAGGLELSEAVTGARAAAERAHAMVDSSPLPLALVDRQGRVQQLNQAGCRLFGIATESQALGVHLEALGLSPSEISLHLVLARPQAGAPWHGRVLVTQPVGDRRICDCTITGLSGVGRDNLLVALYDRTDELRAQRELIAREKLATVGEIASGVAHEVNNPLAAIRMEAELLGRASRNPAAGAAGRERGVPHRPGRRGPGGARLGPGSPAGGDQPRHQRGARRAGAYPRDRSAHHAGARGLGAARGRGFRAGRPARDPGPHLRPVLHHQGTRRGHGPRPRHLPARRDRGRREDLARGLSTGRGQVRGGTAGRARKRGDDHDRVRNGPREGGVGGVGGCGAQYSRMRRRYIPSA